MTNKNNPYSDMIDAVTRALAHKMPLKVYPLNEEGDVRFAVPWSAFSWSNTSLIGQIFCTTPVFTSMIGETLVRANIHAFNNVIASKYYPEACKKYRHTGFGLRTVGQDLVFYLHCTLLLHLFNQYIAKELQEIQKEIINVPAQKKKQSDDTVTVTAYTNPKSYKVAVSKGNLEHSIATALSNILEHFGIKKDVHVTMGMFQMEVEAADKSENP